MVFDFIRNLFRKNDIYKLRKRYDKMREDLIITKKTALTLGILKEMDEIEKHIITLEEMEINPREKRDISIYVKTSLVSLESQMKSISSNKTNKY